MAEDTGTAAGSATEKTSQSPPVSSPAPPKTGRWAWLLRRENKPAEAKDEGSPNSTDVEDEKSVPEKWSLGILNDRETDEVPGSILLMSKQFKRNEPLGLRHAPARNSASSLPSPYNGPDDRPPSAGRSRSPAQQRTSRPVTPQRSSSFRPPLMRMFSGHSDKPAPPEKKTTADGKIILEPQPEESLNDPLNWPSWRRDVALLSLGFYCAMGGGMTPILAAGFNNVAETYSVSVPTVSLTTGFYMLGLGCGSVFASPTAILFGKRPVYIAGALLFIASSIWCAYSPNYASLVVARIFMGFAISPVECLPSATIAEIFYLHERAYRLGIYTLLLLGGKNLIPLISAAIIGGLNWQWVFKVVAIAAAFCVILIFFFVPETFWDRTPRPRTKVRKHHWGSLSHMFTPHHEHGKHNHSANNLQEKVPDREINLGQDVNSGTIAQRRQRTQHHVGFAVEGEEKAGTSATAAPSGESSMPAKKASLAPSVALGMVDDSNPKEMEKSNQPETPVPSKQEEKSTSTPARSEDHNLPYFMSKDGAAQTHDVESGQQLAVATDVHEAVSPGAHDSGASTPTTSSINHTYTQQLRYAPPKTYADTLKPWNGRLRRDNWFKCALRPFILFAYPAILWSALVYALSIGWLIVLSESISVIYREKDTYNFTALQAGLVYLSPFIGGIFGTAVAGKVSDILVRYMAKRNNGIYEPEFRLVMALPILLSTVIGLMGFGWSAEERDNFMVPTVMFGIISFGCSLGSTTSITFAVDSYRQYAGEALVTLNFSKNVLHGFVFSLFFTNWLVADGAKKVFLVIGGIQIICLLSSIPMYIYGKRARMWTVRKNMMEKF